MEKMSKERVTKVTVFLRSAFLILGKMKSDFTGQTGSHLLKYMIGIRSEKPCI